MKAVKSGILSSATGLKLEEISLVEHPGGHDGGEFPCYESFELLDGGKMVSYFYGLPKSSCDTFCDEDPESYNNCPAVVNARNRLKQERVKAEETLELINKMLKALDEGAEYEAVNDEWLPDDDEARWYRSKSGY